jgi:CDP-glucose 4,6-dehydratase
MFAGVYSGLRVLVTGHTGFKGSWLCEWLVSLGAQVTGLALAPETEPALPDVLRLGERVDSRMLDIRDAGAVKKLVEECRPELVFHLAAQPLVRRSYAEPAYTWEVNVGGTVNVLEAVRSVPGVRACVAVTSDKCYENREWLWGYREHDSMGGHDPYSSSKAAAEIAVASWRRSFSVSPDAPRLASARAGNVIGGGDWSADRIVTDFVLSINAGRPLMLRNPAATRPWQHVLEPLSGYLLLGAGLLGAERDAHAQAWNLGPADSEITTVDALARLLIQEWGRGEIRHEAAGRNPHEATALTLDCTKAARHLGWKGIWPIREAVKHTVAWYKQYYAGADMHELTRRQIGAYCTAASAAGCSWTSAGKREAAGE